MNSPEFLAIFSFIFILLGIYNLYAGLRRLREIQASHQFLPWYKQINILTGTEYILLALVFLLSAGIRSGVLPSGLNAIIIPLYLIVLLAAAVFAGLVIRQGITNARQRSRASSQIAQSNNTSGENTTTAYNSTSPRSQRQRERRRNAAAARRRRAGKA